MRTKPVAIAITLALLLGGCAQATPPPSQENHDVGVQLFQWNWDSIGRECTDTLGPSDISWVLTSPPNEHILGDEWWTSYQPVSYLIESRLGTREQFASMVSTCASAGVDVIADAVINHMTGQETPGVGWAGSPYSHYDYPGPPDNLALYGPDDFHHCTESATGDILDYDDAAEVQNCELVNLADLATETPRVQDTIVAYLDDLLSPGVAGFRIDAAKHIPAADIAAIVDRLPEGTRIMQEVIRGSGEPVTPEQYVGSGQVFEFSFARHLREMVQNATLGQGMTFGPDYGTLPSESALVFVDNHDTERNGETLNYKDGAEYSLATTFLLAQPYGTPVLYSGYAFEGRDAGPPQDADGRVTDASCPDSLSPTRAFSPGDWVCQHHWPGVAEMLAFRSAVGDAPVTDEWSDAYAAAFGRGAYGFAVFNTGTDALNRRFETGLAPGTYRDAISGEPVVVAGDGSFTAEVPPMTALAISVADATP